MNNAKDIAGEMNQELEEKIEYLIFQGKLFYGNRNKEHGILLGMVNIEQEEIIRLNLALSTAHKLRKIDPNSTNKEFINFFKNVSLKDRSQGYKIKSNLETRFKTIGVSSLLEYDKDDFENLMIEIIEDTVQEKIELNLDYSLKTKSEMETIYPQLFEDNEDKKQEKDNQDDLIKLKCDPIIAPVAGKKVGELEIGEEILVKLNDSRALYFKEELKDLKDDESDKIKGTVHDLNLAKDKEQIVLQFIHNVYGVITLEEDTKRAGIKLAVPQKEEGDKKKELKKNNKSNFFTISLASLLLIIIAILYLIT